MFRKSTYPAKNFFLLWVGWSFTVQFAKSMPADGNNKSDKEWAHLKNQSEILEEFREKIINQLPEDYMKTDFYLIRWLRAKDYDVEEAFEMLSENLDWREENNMTGILDEDLSDISEDFLITTDAHDRLGQPVATISLATWDIRAGAVQGKVPRLMRYIDQTLEKVILQIIKRHAVDPNVTSATWLIDLEGANAVQHLCSQCTPVTLQIIDGMESHYPGFLHEIIFINPSVAIGKLIALAASVVSKETREAARYFDSKEKWMVYLDERIERSQRYTNFGGTKEY